jgi:hypothetical protein
MAEQHHGIHPTFEVSGESQVVDGVAIKPAKEGPRFGRIFPHSLKTPPFTPDDSKLDELGRTMTVPVPAGVNQNSDVPAGYTYFGQFIDHDISRDGTAELPQDVKAGLPLEEIKQLRSPTLDLDSLYDRQADSPPLEHADGIHMRLGDTQATPPNGSEAFAPVSAKVYVGHDVPRNATTAKADIGDPRNDENLIVQQIHNLFLRFHNAVADRVAAEQPKGTSPAVIFALTRDLVTKHYQWLVLNDFVSRLVDPEILAGIISPIDGTADVMPNPLVFKVSGAQTPPMPLEFSVAAYRLGHSMIRNGYSWNVIFKKPDTDFRLFFQFTQLSGILGPASGLLSFPSNWIADWRRMFRLEDVPGFPPFNRVNGDNPVSLNMALLLDTNIAPVLGNLPGGGGNLAARNLIRGSRMGLPSGQDVADAIADAGDTQTVKMSPAEILNGLPDQKAEVVLRHEFHMKTPLWFYILREAEVAGTGRLGRVGSRIVVETFLALIRCSKTSIFSASADNPGALRMFSPAGDSRLVTPGTQPGPLVTMAHLIAFTGGVNPLGDVLDPDAATPAPVA